MAPTIVRAVAKMNPLCYMEDKAVPPDRVWQYFTSTVITFLLVLTAGAVYSYTHFTQKHYNFDCLTTTGLPATDAFQGGICRCGWPEDPTPALRYYNDITTPESFYMPPINGTNTTVPQFAAYSGSVSYGCTATVDVMEFTIFEAASGKPDAWWLAKDLDLASIDPTLFLSSRTAPGVVYRSKYGKPLAFVEMSCVFQTCLPTGRVTTIFRLLPADNTIMSLSTVELGQYNHNVTCCGKFLVRDKWADFLAWAGVLGGIISIIMLICHFVFEFWIFGGHDEGESSSAKAQWAAWWSGNRNGNKAAPGFLELEDSQSVLQIAPSMRRSDYKAKAFNASEGWGPSSC